MPTQTDRTVTSQVTSASSVAPQGFLYVFWNTALETFTRPLV